MQAGAGLRSLNPEMEDAARVLGAGRLTTLARIVLPLLKSGLIGSWLLVFIGATRELSTAIFLTGPKVTSEISTRLTASSSAINSSRKASRPAFNSSIGLTVRGPR